MNKINIIKDNIIKNKINYIELFKDLVILNWEQNPQNLIINTRYNYSYVIKKYTTINNNILQANTRTNILNFAWYFQRIYKK